MDMFGTNSNTHMLQTSTTAISCVSRMQSYEPFHSANMKDTIHGLAEHMCTTDTRKQQQPFTHLCNAGCLLEHAGERAATAEAHAHEVADKVARIISHLQQTLPSNATC